MIRHRRDPGLQTAIISNTKAMASTRIQLMTNGYAHVGAGVGDRYDRAALFLNPNTHDAGTRCLDIMAANSVGIHRLGLAGDAIDIRAHMNGRQRFEDFLIVVRFGFGLGLLTGPYR